jgi:hypothetical protein
MTRQNIIRKGFIASLAGSSLEIGTLPNRKSDRLKLSTNSVCCRTDDLGFKG